MWVTLTYENGSTQRAKAFGMAWTKDKRLVRAQWVEYSQAREAWVPASACVRREIPKRT